jgi:hypothetical protein
MNARIIKALLLTASLAGGLASGCADMRDHFAAAGASTANDGATAPRLHSAFSGELPFGN